jgi:hypothetical protein
VTYQLRHYKVRPGAMDSFVAAWRENVLPIRRRLGFIVVGAWVVPESDEFVWIMGYDDDADGFAAADAAYYASDDRQALTGDEDPGSYLEESQTRLMDPVDLPAG